MWKKFLVVCVCLVGTFSIAFASKHQLSANVVASTPILTMGETVYIGGTSFLVMDTSDPSNVLVLSKNPVAKGPWGTVDNRDLGNELSYSNCNSISAIQNVNTVLTALEKNKLKKRINDGLSQNLYLPSFGDFADLSSSNSLVFGNDGRMLSSWTTTRPISKKTFSYFKPFIINSSIPNILMNLETDMWLMEGAQATGGNSTLYTRHMRLATFSGYIEIYPARVRLDSLGFHVITYIDSNDISMKLPRTEANTVSTYRKYTPSEYKLAFKDSSLELPPLEDFSQGMSYTKGSNGITFTKSPASADPSTHISALIQSDKGEYYYGKIAEMEDEKLLFDSLDAGTYQITMFVERVNGNDHANDVSNSYTTTLKVYDQLGGFDPKLKSLTYGSNETKQNGVISENPLKATGGNTESDYTFTIQKSKVYIDDSLRYDGTIYLELDETNNVVVKQDLPVGEYVFILKVQDNNGATIEKEMSVVVYPSDIQIDFKPQKHHNGTIDDITDDRWFNVNEVNENTELANIVFDEQTNLQLLLDLGYELESIDFLEKGTSTKIDEFYAEMDPNDIQSYSVKWNKLKSMPTGKTEMDLIIRFVKNGVETKVIKKSNLSLMINNSFDLTKLKWQKKDTVPQTFGDVQGSINTSGINSNEVSVGYVSQGSFYTQVTQLSGYTDLTDASIEYSLKQGSTSGIISVVQNGKVTILKTSPENADVKIQAKITKDGFQDAYVYLPVKITQGKTVFSYVDQNGSQLPIVNDKYKPYQVDGKNVAYSKEGKIQLYTSGNSQGTKVSYEMKDGSPTDVVSVDPGTGAVTILNATTALQKDKVIIVATAHDPSGNYEDVSIELPINIDKAKQTIGFVENPINVANGKGSISPEVKDQDISSNNGGTQISDTNYIITVDDSACAGCAWTNDGKEILYEYEGDEGINITLKVSKPGNRNYENVGPVETKLHITGKEEAVFEVSKPGKITYGDHFKIQSLQDDSGSSGVKYEFTLDNSNYIKKKDETENDGTGEFDAITASGSNTVEISVTRTAIGELPMTKKVTIKILPKDISIKIDDQEKLRGEINPSLTYQEFSSQLVLWNDKKDVIQNTDIKLSTTATQTSAVGNYPITGDHAYLHKTYPNYSFTFTNGTLKVNEELIEDNWYHLELDDGKNTSYSGKWTNQNVNIISDHDEYVNISEDQSTWTPNKITVNTEGKIEQSFWLKKDSGAITGEKKETILIDKTAPILKSVTAKDSRNQLQVLINTLSNGFFFRPNTTFEIMTSDVKEKLETSGTTSIDYKLYDSDKKLIKQDTLSVTKEKASLTIQETTGTYQLCMILKDQAGNESGEVCKTVDLKEIGQDSDGDGIPDINIDTDGDGKPDLNITKKQCDDLDEDRDCKIPYLNIDTIGDGQSDMNIDTDGDGIPDLNTGIVKEWKPDTLVDLDKDGKPEYKTSSTLKGLNNIDTDGDHYPDLNIDRDLDGIPELNINTDGKLDKPQTNIDGNGDGIANINIDENGDGIPEKNVMDITEWKPEHNVTNEGKVVYDTMKLTFKEVDELEDNGIKVQPSDPNVSFLPNMALKVDDITANTSDDTKKDIIKDSGETDKEVKKVYDVKLLEDNKVIQPDGSLKVSIPVDESVQNAKVMMKAKDGTWKVMEVKVENGYYVFETDYIGEVSVIGDPEVSDVKEPTQTPEPNPDVKDVTTTNPTVQGTYTTKATYPGNNTGGASTGDHTNILLFGILGTLSMTMILILYLKKKREDSK